MRGVLFNSEAPDQPDACDSRYLMIWGIKERNDSARGELVMNGVKVMMCRPLSYQIPSPVMSSGMCNGLSICRRACKGLCEMFQVVCGNEETSFKVVGNWLVLTLTCV